jgi:hypothetical protein
MPRLLLATGNKGKAEEYRELLRGIPYDLVTPGDVGIATVVEETGDTLEENARLKAVTLCRESGLIAIADDSGLFVDVLNGEPGHHAARYAGELGKPELTFSDQALAVNPADAAMWYVKGAILFNHMRQHRDALACFEEAKRLGLAQAAMGVTMCQRTVSR